jgi:predicted nucleotidyltransferase
MVTMQEIQDVCNQIVQQFHPEKVILFGSYAYGTPRPDSDVDLLVVMPEDAGTGLKKAIEILTCIEMRFSMDLLVRSAAQIQQRIEWKDFFMIEVVNRGKVLYESSAA